jgi:hypothetical protein
VLTSLNVFHGANVTVGLLRTNVDSAYRARHDGVAQTKDNDGNEHALHAFNGKCNNCGKTMELVAVTASGCQLTRLVICAATKLAK